MTRVVTWNVNSIKARIRIVTRWLKAEQPDVLLMQETKCTDDAFPRDEFAALGYHIETVGQRAYNGVAILSRHPLEVAHRRLPGNPGDDQARYIEAVVVSPAAKRRRARAAMRVASIYLPNGNPTGSENFGYKVDCMMRLVRHARRLAKSGEVVVLGGDYNVAPSDADVYDPVGWRYDALCQPEPRAEFQELLKLGFADAIATRHPEPGNYTFWDYQGRAWQRNHGWRIDHLLLSPQALGRLVECGIDKKERGKASPSDHVPVWCDLDI
jgi:exodeoxyribonuclease-3